MFFQPRKDLIFANFIMFHLKYFFFSLFLPIFKILFYLLIFLIFIHISKLLLILPSIFTICRFILQSLIIRKYSPLLSTSFSIRLCIITINLIKSLVWYKIPSTILASFYQIIWYLRYFF